MTSDLRMRDDRRPRRMASTDANRSSDEARQGFRDAMARLAAAVSLVTTDGPGGRAGFAATAVCSLTDDPPTLIVCINRKSSAYPSVRSNGRLCVNVLAADQVALGRAFGGGTPMERRFEAGTWTATASGQPALEDALAVADCEIADVADGGTHDVLFCRVIRASTRRTGGALVYADRTYHGLPSA